MGRKKIDEDLNLAPFIGLFSLLVCMLLVTAVWLRLSVLSSNIDNVTSSDSPSPENNEKKVSLVVTLMDRYIEMAEDTRKVRVDYVQNDEGKEIVNRPQLTQVLEGWRDRHPKRKDVILNTENSVPYKHMITTFDTLVGEGWHDVGVNTQ